MQTINLITTFLKSVQPNDVPLLVLLGPTASGKTALSLTLAKQFNGEIISADSRQVYRYMNIGTDKIPLEEREGVPHYLIDLVNPDERFTVVDFKKLAEEKIAEIARRGKLPILVGGTGLYIRAITENFDIPPSDDLALRTALEQEALKEAENGQEAQKLLHQKLAKVDPQSAAKIHPSNTRYVLRALEIFYHTGAPKSDKKSTPKYRVLKIGLALDRSELDKRIHRRVDEQFKKGLVEEIKRLLERGYDERLPALQTLGYRELIPALRGKISIDDAKELIKMHTRQFARRQITWFKKEKDVKWIIM